MSDKSSNPESEINLKTKVTEKSRNRKYHKGLETENEDITSNPESEKSHETTEKDKSSKSSETIEKDKSSKSSETTEKDKSSKSSETTEKDKPSKSSETTEKDKSSKSSETTEKDKSSKSSETTEKEKPSKSSETTEKDKSSKSSETTMTDKSIKSSETTMTDKSIKSSETTMTDNASDHQSKRNIETKIAEKSSNRKPLKNLESKISDKSSKCQSEKTLETTMADKLSDFESEQSFDPHTKTEECGIFGVRPKILQKLVDWKWFLCVFMWSSLYLNMPVVAITARVDQVQKYFGLSLTEFQMANAIDNIGNLTMFLFIPVLSRLNRRPLFMGLAVALIGFGYFLVVLSHLLTDENAYMGNIGSPGQKRPPQTCGNTTNIIGYTGGDKTWWPLVVIGLFLNGVGNSLYSSWAQSYLDDNTPPRFTPIALSVVMLAKIIPGALGAIILIWTWSWFVVPGKGEGISSQDNRFIGNWWFPFAIATVGTLSGAPLLALFPQKLKGGRPNAVSTNKGLKELPKFITDIWNTMKRLCTNSLYVVFVLNTILLGIATNILKSNTSILLNEHYRSSENVTIIALPAVVTGIAGLMLCGLAISYFKISARAVGIFNVFCIGLTLALTVVVLFLPCNYMTPHGYGNEDTECSTDCDCGNVTLSKTTQICSMDGQHVWPSGCHAGCKQNMLNMGFLWYDCKCILEVSKKFNTTRLEMWQEKAKKDLKPFFDAIPKIPGTVSQATSLKCAQDDVCHRNTYIFIAISIFTPFFMLGGPQGGTKPLFYMRMIEKRDKNYGVLLVGTFATGISGTLGPIISGALSDMCCVAWRDGKCIFTDYDKTRKVILGSAAGALGLTLITEIFILAKIWNLDLYKVEEEDKAASASSTDINDSSDYSDDKTKDITQGHIHRKHRTKTKDGTVDKTKKQGTEQEKTKKEADEDTSDIEAGFKKKPTEKYFLDRDDTRSILNIDFKV